MFRRVGDLDPYRGCPIIYTLVTWIVFVWESHAALYGKRQPHLGGLKDHRILISGIIEALRHFLICRTSSGNMSLILRQSNPRV